MISFDPLGCRYPSVRSVVYAKNGMCCAGNPSAASAGLRILAAGGNAVDAAVGMALAQPVVEPTGNGLGSECFAIIWYKGKLYGINGSGPSPRSLSLEALRGRGLTEMPMRGVEVVDVPGAVATWCAVHERFGSMALADVAAPAITYAEEGFPVSPVISRLWGNGFRTFSELAKTRPEFEGWMQTFAPGGRPPAAGDIARSRAMAETIRRIAATGGRDFYEGAIAERTDAYMRSVGGFLTGADLESFKPEWVDPLKVNYHGVDVWEMPPNGHGITVLMALKILSGIEADYDTPAGIHRQLEALKLAFSDAKEYVTEPSCMQVTTDELLSDAYAARRRSLIGERALMPEAGDPRGTSTVYFCTADRDGNMVSMIQSNFCEFGSGIVDPQTGISFNNRGYGFRFSDTHPNGVAGGKRPYNTIIPGFLTQEGEPLGPFGIMGGFMQPQAHVQVVMNMIDRGMSPQQALDAPRWQWVGGRKVEVEWDMPHEIVNDLVRRGHEVVVNPDSIHMGRGQVILRNPETGVYAGGTEKRTDGQIMSY